MNTPSSHRPDPSGSPLDAEERALAEALRSLPAADPDAALDARILAMAHQAVATPAKGAQRRRRPPAGLWWLGTAAGAVLAAGIGWQLSQQHGHELQGGQSPRPPQRSSSDASAAKAEEAFDVEIIRRAPSESAPISRDDNNALGAAESNIDTERPARSAAAKQPMPASAPAPAAPAAPLAERRETDAAEPRADSPPAPRELTRRQALPEEPAVALPDAQNGAGAASLDRIEVTGSRARSNTELDDQGFPAVLQDARLRPEQWLLRVRARRDAGQAEHARKSLQEFVRSYPYLVVPEDLRPLLNERP